jgi:NAD dependent epimerase/dehydratase
MPQPIRHVLVTGAAGFIGSHLTEACVAAGYEVRALVRYNSQGRRGWLDGSPAINNVDVVFGDVRDRDSVDRAMRGIDTVFHLAALIGIPYSYESPLAYVRTNVEGTANVLMAARAFDVGNVVITSTSETYGTAQRVPIDESHPAVAQSPYAATKIAADQLGRSFHRSFGLGVKIIRPFNTYGPRQSLRAVIPTIITQALAGGDIRLGNVQPTRDLTFVTDTVAAFLAVARSDATVGVAVNAGMNSEISVGALAETIVRLIGVPARIVSADERVRPAASEVDRLVCDNSLLMRTTGWRPEYTLERGLQETIAWFRAAGQASVDAGRYHL